MATFVLIHGAGDGGWSWHRVAAELGARGHDVVAPDLPEDETADLGTYADEVVGAIGTRSEPRRGRPFVRSLHGAAHLRPLPGGAPRLRRRHDPVTG